MIKNSKKYGKMVYLFVSMTLTEHRITEHARSVVDGYAHSNDVG